MTSDGSLLPNGAGRFDASACVVAARFAGQPRNRSSSSPRRQLLSDVPDSDSGPKRNPFGRGLLPRGCSNGTVDVASVEGVGRRPRPCGGVATICHLHDTTSSGRCGRGRGSSSPARRRVTKVDRQDVAAGDCSPVTASASRLAEQRPSVGEVALSHLVAVGVSSSPANIGSSFRGRAAAAAPPSRRLCHACSGHDVVVTARRAEEQRRLRSTAQTRLPQVRGRRSVAFSCLLPGRLLATGEPPLDGTVIVCADAGA